MNSYHANLTLIGLGKISKLPEFRTHWRVFCLDDKALALCNEKVPSQVCSRTKETFAEASDFKKHQFTQIGFLKLRLALEILLANSTISAKQLAIFDGDVMHFGVARKLP